jgi:hypothetical protein
MKNVKIRPHFKLDNLTDQDFLHQEKGEMTKLDA